MNEKIAVIDDEPDIQELISINLKKSGFEPACFNTATSFLQALNRNRPDLIILDLMLPDQDGYEFCRNLKKSQDYQDIPILIVSARSEETDKVLGLELGADDYLTKPFSVRELIARIRALLRRTQINSETALKTRILAGDLIIDLEKFEITHQGKLLDVTVTEFRILQLLVQNPGVVFSRERILDYLWGSEKAVIDRTIDVHIKKLRDKLGDSGVLIRNIRGVGYKFSE